MIEPALGGAVVFSVKLALPFNGRTALNVTEQTSAGAAPVQLTADTPVPAEAPTYATPAGNCSLIVTTWPTAAGVWPLLLIVKLYARLLPVTTVAGADLVAVRFIGVFTVVPALAQLVVVLLVHPLVPGSTGVPLPLVLVLA